MLLWALLSALISFLTCRYLIKFLPAKKIAVQAPRDRDVHKSPTPRMGGVGIFTGFLVMVILTLLIMGRNFDFGFPYEIFGLSIDKRLLGIILSSTFLVSIMAIDDIRGLNPFVKLASQIFAAIILILTGVGITYLNNPLGLAIPLDTYKIPLQIAGNTFNFVVIADLLFIIWIVLLTNATNFIDGLDGLAGSLSLIASIILMFVSISVGQPSTALLCAILAGGILGFLIFNFPKGDAKIFLGDTGSMFLGLMLATISVITGGKLATVALVYGLVIIDALYVIVKRIFAGKNPFTTSDQSHLHHRFLQAGLTKIQTLMVICAMSLLFGLSALLLEPRSKVIAIIILTIFSLAVFVALDLYNKKRPSVKLT